MYAEAVGYYKEIKERGIPMSAYTVRPRPYPKFQASVHLDAIAESIDYN